ncbi:hypothetical protein C2U51_06000 [Enterobacteriaceae bacterium ENNIH1]|nr:hypothetical protein C2U51_06000 [Enterobacteriaceae bacterium ENNIH1]
MWLMKTLLTSGCTNQRGAGHHHFSKRDANRWIELNQPEFVDKTPDHSENRLWMLRGMGSIR